jgi:hypothetical protein
MHSFSNLAKLSVSTLVLLLVAAPAQAGQSICDDASCQVNLRGGVTDDSSVERKAVEPNSEQSAVVDDGEGYSISVDGEVVAGAEKLVDAQRQTDVALEQVDIQVKFDGLDVKPMLNVTTVPVRRAYRAGEQVDFVATLNYGAWITKAEIRIFAKGDQAKPKPFMVLPVAPSGVASWPMPNGAVKNFTYVLRVYDSQGRYDETLPLTLVRSTANLPQHAPADAAVAPGYSEDRTAIRNIPVYGGAVTVFGRNVLGEDAVTVMGEVVPVDAEGKFVVQRILPPGDHDISVGVLNEKSKGLEFHRDINIPSSDWFYVGLADVTVGKRFGDDGIENVKQGEFDSVYSKGRLAFYLKGKMKGRTILTAAADTGEDKLQNLFKGFDGKDPKQFLKRIDPDAYYPVYGDDSAQVEDAPTRGKFYVRLERGDSAVMWGNFKTRITGSRFLRNERALYGGSAVYKSETQAPGGDRSTEVDVYAAQPGTLPAHDELRGTGGSAYFLKHQDVTIGSETVNIITRDSITNRVLDRRQLRFGVDYDLDHVQGIIILRTPLQSTAAGDGVVRSLILGGNPVFLTVSYEFTPAASDVKGYVYGGRAQQWLGDHLRVGVTGMNEKTGAADQKMAGVDVHLQKSDGVYVEGEFAQSRGPGFGKSTSADGGLTIDNLATAGQAGRTADAWRLAGHADLGDITNGKLNGALEVVYEHKQGGFSSLEEQVTDAKDTLSVKGNVELTETVSMGGEYAELHMAGGKMDREAELHSEVALGDHVYFAPGVRHSVKKDPAGTVENIGQRTDVGGKLTYKVDDDRSAYMFGQGTVARSGGRKRNDRLGVGGETRLTEKTTLAGEASFGSSGLGGLANLGYQPTADDNYYIGYRLDPDRDGALGANSILSGDDLGQIVAGTRHRVSEQVLVFAEDSYDMFGDKRTLAQTYGVDYTPNARWSFGGNAEWGRIVDQSIDAATGVKRSDFDRKALGVSAAYKAENGNTGRVKSEMRLEDSEDGTRDMTSYLFAANIGIKHNENWRFIGTIDAVLADATDTTRDGRYVETALGYAYRPVEHDKLNALFKYTFLYDLPGKDQVGVDGTTAGLEQISHIFGADVSYDVTDVLTMGAKYGFRIGDTRPRDRSSDWEQGSAHLGIIRADLTVIKNWDVLAEGRVLYAPDSESVNIGALAAIYRHLGDNFKVGVGYNIGSFSDDLRDITKDDHGIFINAIGKF